MGTLEKALAVFLVTVLVSIPVVGAPCSAQTSTPLPSYIEKPDYPKPSIPEFTVQLVGPKYTNPTVYILNETTGEIAAQIGYTNQYSSVLVTITNQHFTPFDSDFNGMVSLMYNIRIKNHQTNQEWTEVYHASDGYPTQNSDGSTTELGFSIEGQRGLEPLSGSQIDIQVQAMIGTVHRMIVGGFAPYFFDGQVSGWSRSQTVSIPANVPLDSSSTTPTSTAQSTAIPTEPPDLTSPFLIAVATTALAVIALLLGVITYLLIYIRKSKNAVSQKPDSP